MSFGAGTSAMAKSIKANLALRKGRNGLFERAVSLTIENRLKIALPEPTAQVREKFQLKLEEEIRRDNTKLATSVVVGIALVISLYFYGDDFLLLFVHEGLK